MKKIVLCSGQQEFKVRNDMFHSERKKIIQKLLDLSKSLNKTESKEYFC